MRGFIIGDEQIKALANLRENAEKHRIAVDEMLDIYNGQADPVGDRRGFSCNIPVGYRVVFCIEYQKKGWARHLSVSIHPKKGNTSAHPIVIKELMEYLGFVGKMDGKEVMVYFEDKNTIVNVIEYIKEEGTDKEGAREKN